jgi:exocyst complex component 8
VEKYALPPPCRRLRLRSRYALSAQNHAIGKDDTSAADRRRNVRSSIADLRVIYANQMQTLHSQIEGSAKFAPTTPGRHVVTEMDGILVLNTATYKVERTVRFVVLDDFVLVARRRRRPAGVSVGTNAEGGKLVAERAWPLNEMLVLDTKDTPSMYNPAILALQPRNTGFVAGMMNVFKIRHNKETHVYRTESPSDKKVLLSSFRHVAEELAAKKRRDREGEHERRKSLWASTEDVCSALH